MKLSSFTQVNLAFQLFTGLGFTGAVVWAKEIEQENVWANTPGKITVT